MTDFDSRAEFVLDEFYEQAGCEADVNVRIKVPLHLAGTVQDALRAFEGALAEVFPVESETATYPSMAEAFAEAGLTDPDVWVWSVDGDRYHKGIKGPSDYRARCGSIRASHTYESSYYHWSAVVPEGRDLCGNCEFYMQSDDEVTP